MGLENSSFQLKVTTSADCTLVTGFTLPATFPTAIAYQISSTQQPTILPAANFAQNSGINDVCGPIGSQVSLTDVTGLTTSTMPVFSSFNNSTRALDINTLDPVYAGTYNFAYDVFLCNFFG